MSEQLHSGFQNLDDFLRNTLNNHQAELSPNLWGKMKTKLFKNDVSEFVRFKKLQKAFHPQCKSVSLQIKILTSYAAAACLMVGIVYGSTYYIGNIIKGPEQKTEKDVNPAMIKEVKPNPNNSNVELQKIPEMSSLPLAAKENDKLAMKQNAPIAENSITPVKDKSLGNNIINNAQQVNNKPVASNNLNTLIDYIQRINPQNKIVTANNTEQVTEDVEETNISDFEITGDVQENNIQTPVYQIEIPNVITPNGDGFNDVLVIKNLDKYTDNNLLIADRAGKEVYQKNSYQNDWDAQNLPDGTYYYILSYKDKNNSRGVIKGLITILRK
jgi:gliding motility-associated-like protein